VNIQNVLLWLESWMQAWRRLRQWSMASSITLRSTPTHTSVRRRLKSFTPRAFVW